MATNSSAGPSEGEELLPTIFEKAMKQFDLIQQSNEPISSSPMQVTVKKAIQEFEKATNLVSLCDVFSRNESYEELPTETLQYLLLPALLGTLTLKICEPRRKEIIEVAEIYFRDFLKRCKDYGLTDVELPQLKDDSQDVACRKPRSEQAKIANMVQTREAKIKRYKEMKELEEKLKLLSVAMSSPHADESTKRRYFITLITSFVGQAVDELYSIEQEKPILDYMAKHGDEAHPKKERSAPLKPVIITRDQLQKAVYGAGYPSLPTLSIEEFYDQRVREGVFPGSCNISTTTISNTEASADDADEVRKEQLLEEEDPEELERLRRMDEFKDDHRRGEGNRYNRS